MPVVTTPVNSLHDTVLGHPNGRIRTRDPRVRIRLAGQAYNGTMTIDLAVVPFPLGSFRATVDDGVVRGATFDLTPQPRAPRPVRRARRPRRVLRRATSPRSTRLTVGCAAARRSSTRSGSELRRIPVGTTISYGELARRVGRPTRIAARSGMANAVEPDRVDRAVSPRDPHGRRARRLRVRPRLQALAARARGARTRSIPWAVATPWERGGRSRRRSGRRCRRGCGR